MLVCCSSPPFNRWNMNAKDNGASIMVRSIHNDDEEIIFDRNMYIGNVYWNYLLCYFKGILVYNCIICIQYIYVYVYIHIYVHMVYITMSKLNNEYIF